MIYASRTDLEEAYQLGKKAVLVALNDGGGFMSTILREPGEVYKVRYDKVGLQLVANSERKFPQEWIAPSRCDVTDDFVRYARPLIGDEWVTLPVENGVHRFARLEPKFATKNCKPYVPMAYRPKSQ
jgi:6-phosphofructokinase 1